MRTTVTLDESLLSELTQLSGEKTKTSAVAKAAQEYIRRKKLLKLASLLGDVQIDESALADADKADMERADVLEATGDQNVSKH
jgi:hypothetical protein